MIKGFREFILRGNVVDLAVGIVIGTAFGKVVDSLVSGLINPIVAAIFGKPDLSSVGNFSINHAQFSIGLILTAVINFVLVAAAIYFIVVVPVNKLRSRFEKPAEEILAGPSEVDLLTEIRDSLRNRA
jgi:large conductance mechanosensitive channel